MCRWRLVVLQKSKDGHALVYASKVLKREITLPADADLIVDPDSVLQFQVRTGIPKERDGHVGYCLRMDRDDFIAVSWVTLNSSEKIQAFEKSGSVPFKMVPGTYYLHALYIVDRKRKYTYLGRVIIGEGDAGKTLEVEEVE